MSLFFNRAANRRVLLGPSSALRNVAGGALSIWGNTSTAQYQFALFYSTGIGTAARLAIWWAWSIGQVYGYSRRQDGDAYTGVAAVTGPGLHHVVLNAFWTGQHFDLWVDGVLAAEKLDAAWTGNSSNTDSLTSYIGNEATFNYPFDGPLDDARCYNRTLSDNEIRTLYAARGRDRIVQGLQSRWKMAEESPGVVAAGAAVVRDTGPQSQHGTPVNGPVYSEALVSALHSRRR